MATILENKTLLMKLFSFLKRHFLLFFLLCFGLIIRILYIENNVIPFSFDHGKDSIATMDLLINKNLKFVGPWTSIPGLYFGPGWYYLIAPGLLLTNFSPIGPVLIMILLILLQVYLAYKYFGIFAAVIVTTTPFWLMMSKSAWNPFPMTFISWVILIILQKYKKSGWLKQKQFYFLGFVASLGFHFSAAFAIFYPIIVFLFILKNRLKITINNIILLSTGFLTAFIPQLLFELKNNFIQTRGVINYFLNNQSDAISKEKLIFVTNSYFNALPSFIFPDSINQQYRQVITLFFLIIIVAFLIRYRKRLVSNSSLDLFDSLLFIGIPYIGFLFLHFNVWYYYAIAPVMVIMFAKVLHNLKLSFKFLVLCLYVLSPFISYYSYVTVDKETLESSRNFLPAKQKAVEFIYKESEGKPFASYHYVPDIYDYSYQYIYFWQAKNGKHLPIEFSYKPGETSYIPEKSNLLTKFPTQGNQKPEKIFFIVETPENTEFLDEWWNAQQYREIVKTTSISRDINVYEAIP